MSSADPTGGAKQYPLLIVVKFDPSSLPQGMVDAADFGDFLDGLQLALSGQIDYDIQTGYIASDERARYRLIMADVRRGSVEAYLLAQIFDDLTPQALQGLLAEVIAATGGTALLVSVLNKYLESIAQEVGKKHGEYLADKLDLQRVGLYFKRFIGHVRTFASGNRDKETALPSPLVLSMSPGMKQMAEVGAKPEYQARGGVLVSDDTAPDEVIAFNAETHHTVAEAIQRAKRTDSPVDLVGSVDEPSDRRGTFVLAQKDVPPPSRYVRCRAPNNEDRALLRGAYASGSLVQIRGIKRFYPQRSIGGKPRSIVIITHAALVDQMTLWGKV